GSVGSDYLDLTVRGGCENEVVQALGAYLARESVILDMTQLRRDGSVAARLAAELTQRGWIALETRTGVCPFVSLGWRSVRRSRRARASTTSCTVTKSISSGGRGRSGS